MKEGYNQPSLDFGCGPPVWSYPSESIRSQCSSSTYTALDNAVVSEQAGDINAISNSHLTSPVHRPKFSHAALSDPKHYRSSDSHKTDRSRS